MPAGRAPHFDLAARLPFCRNDHATEAPAGAFIEITGALGTIPVATGTRPTRTGYARRIAVTLRAIGSTDQGPIRQEGNVWLRVQLAVGEKLAANVNVGGRVGTKRRSWYGVPDIGGIAWVQKLYDPDGTEVASYENEGAVAVIVEALVLLDHKRIGWLAIEDRE